MGLDGVSTSLPTNDGPAVAVEASSPDLVSEFEATVRAQAAHFAALLEREGPRLRGSGSPDRGFGQLTAIKLLGLEQPNILELLDTALRRGLLPHLLTAARHLGALCDILSAFQLESERYRLLVEAAQRIGNVELELEARLGCCNALWQLGSIPAGQAEAETALALAEKAGDAFRAGRARNSLGLLLMHQGHGERAIEHFEATLAVFEASGYLPGQARALANLALIHMDFEERRPAALDLLERSLAISRSNGDELAAARTLSSIGIVRFFLGDAEQALAMFGQSRTVFQNVGDEVDQSRMLGNMASVHVESGQFERAAELQLECLRLGHRLGAQTDLVMGCGQASAILAGLHCFEAAAVVMEGAQTQAVELGCPSDSEARKMAQSLLEQALAAGAVSPAELAVWKAQGEAKSLSELVEFTLAALAEQVR